MAHRRLILPPSAQATAGLSRRTFMRGMAGAAMIPVLQACGSDSGTTTSGASTGTGSEAAGSGDVGTVSLGSNYSDAVPRDALAEALAGFTGEVDLNTVDHNTFQEQINTYLQGRPDDVFAWFAGFRMQFFAERGLAAPITDVWDNIGSEFSDAMRQASTGSDGEQYFVPFYYYPWAMFYRKSVFADNGYEIPETLDDLESLAQGMQDDGLVPIAFADQDGWPAMGTFDYLNTRTNGYDFHVSLMAGDEPWDDDRVREVFNNWERLLPYHQEGALGRTWQDAAQTLSTGESGMYLLGMFVGQQFEGEVYDDLDFFAFPEINPEFGRDTVEAPIDGFMMSSEAGNADGAKALLSYLGTAEAQTTYLATDPNNVAANSNADTSNYNALQTKAVELIGGADHITQFLDRDTRPDFASTVMIPSLQAFLQNPGDVASILTSIEEQKQSIFATEQE